MKTRKKQQKDEAFPVASLFISKKLRPIVSAYYDFARYADDIADDPKLESAQKLKQLDKLEDIFLGSKQYSGSKLDFVVHLRKLFNLEGLSRSLITDLITAFKRDAKDTKYQTWAQLIDYCSYSAATVGRFMLAIHNESPSTYQPASSICTALQLVNHLSDLKYDYKKLKRVYLPQDLMDQFGVKQNDFGKSKSTPELKSLIAHISDLVYGQLKDGEVLPSILKSRKLRFQVSIILSLTNIMLQKINKGDVLKKEIKLTNTDWFCGVIKGVVKALFTKRKTLKANYEQY